MHGLPREQHKSLAMQHTYSPKWTHAGSSQASSPRVAHPPPAPNMYEQQYFEMLSFYTNVATTNGMSPQLSAAAPPHFHPHHFEAPPSFTDAEKFKTEMCRKFSQTGFCRYGDQCQFAHGQAELRVLPKHPLYKTNHCKSFEATGTCRYGIRCRFIHDEDAVELAQVCRMPPTTPLSSTFPLLPEEYPAAFAAQFGGAVSPAAKSPQNRSAVATPSVFLLDSSTTTAATPLRTSRSLATLPQTAPNIKSLSSQSTTGMPTRSLSFGSHLHTLPETPQRAWNDLLPPSSPTRAAAPFTKSASFASGIWALDQDLTTTTLNATGGGLLANSKSTIGLQTATRHGSSVWDGSDLPRAKSQESRLDRVYTHHQRSNGAAEQLQQVGLDMDSDDEDGAAFF